MNIATWLLIAAIIAIFIAHKRGLLDKTHEANSPAPPKLPFPCVIEGSIDAPPMEERMKALAIEAQSKGITITGDYPVDVKAQGGEMILIGYSFRFEFNADGQVVPSASHANLFGVNYPVQGGMNPDGTLGMDIVVETARVQVQGSVVDGKFSGKAVKSWLPHIYGILNGVYRHV